MHCKKSTPILQKVCSIGVVFLYAFFQQFHSGFFGGVIGAQLAAEGAGEDGFFNEVDLCQHPFGNFLGLLFFGEKVIEAADYFGLLTNSWNRDWKPLKARTAPPPSLRPSS